jgi:hypothetical protein
LLRLVFDAAGNGQSHLDAPQNTPEGGAITMMRVVTGRIRSCAFRTTAAVSIMMVAKSCGRCRGSCRWGEALMTIE